MPTVDAAGIRASLEWADRCVRDAALDIRPRAVLRPMVVGILGALALATVVEYGSLVRTNRRDLVLQEVVGRDFEVTLKYLGDVVGSLNCTAFRSMVSLALRVTEETREELFLSIVAMLDPVGAELAKTATTPFRLQ